MPVIVRDIDRNTATIVMVDSNLQRENILPSERARAYKMKLDAIKRQGARHDLTCTQVGHKSNGIKSIQKVADEAGESRTQVQRYIRLNELQPELQHLVDEGKIGMTPAVEISYLKPDEQKMLVETIDSEQATPSFSQAQRMRRLSQEGKLNDDAGSRYYDGAKETGKLGFETPDGENQKVLPSLLYTAANGGNHNQAA